MTNRLKTSWRLAAAALALGCAGCQTAVVRTSALSPDLPEAPTISADNTWAFEPQRDRFSPEALLDLRALNETVAGETGFVGRSPDGGDFARGDGTPLRFWAATTYVYADPDKDLAFHARFLAKRGVNMVRWHGTIFPRQEGARLQDIDARARDGLWRLVAAMKQEGIYVTVSPYYARPFKPQPSWATPRDSQGFYGLLFFDPILQQAYKTWLRELFTVENPYTGLALKDDPAVAIVQLQNEDSLLFWTFNRIEGRDRALLGRQYARWLQQKYGSLAAARRAWRGMQLEDDDFAGGVVGLFNLWELTQPLLPFRGGKARRLADQTEFLTATMRQFNAEIARYLRQELGVKQLINAGNWKTVDAARLNDAERYSYTANEVIAVNRYYNGGPHQGPHSGWAIVNGDRFGERSVLFNPDKFPLNLKQVAGHPMLVTESSWVPPLGYQSEGPFLTSVYQSLTGIDGFYWFSLGVEGWRQPSWANDFKPSLRKWIADTPELLGNFPAAALLYRRGYVRTGRPVLEERRPLADLWQRRPAVLAEAAGFDPNRDRGWGQRAAGAVGRIDPLAFLVGPVKVTYGRPAAESAAIDTAPYIDRQAKVLRSVTGEVVWDYGRGICTLNAPKARGATGFLGSAGEIALDGVTISAKNHYATALLIALDDRELGRSRRALLQIGTIARSTGWQATPTTWETERGNRETGYEVLDRGRAPWRIVNTEMTVEIANPHFTRAIALDINGMPQATVPLQRSDDGRRARFVLPASGKYFILE